jgi:hypothetical protein
MSDCCPFLPPIELAARPEHMKPRGYDIGGLTHNPDFQAITDQNSQLFCLRDSSVLECGFGINEKELGNICEINVGRVKKLLHGGRKQSDTGGAGDCSVSRKIRNKS